MTVCFPAHPVLWTRKAISHVRNFSAWLDPYTWKPAGHSRRHLYVCPPRPNRSAISAGHPLVTDLKSPLLLGVQAGLLVILVVGLVAQMIYLTRQNINAAN